MGEEGDGSERQSLVRREAVTEAAGEGMAVDAAASNAGDLVADHPRSQGARQRGLSRSRLAEEGVGGAAALDAGAMKQEAAPGEEPSRAGEPQAGHERPAQLAL